MGGTITGVLEWGAFVDIGYEKDGLLHATEASDRAVSDLRVHLHANERISGGLYVKAIDLSAGRFTLSSRPPAPKPPDAQAAKCARAKTFLTCYSLHACRRWREKAHPRRQPAYD